MALCSLAHRMSRKHEKPVENKAAVDALGICNTLQARGLSCCQNRIPCEDVYTYSRVGFCVALPKTGWACETPW